MGEDRNWLRVILELPGTGMIRQFWQWDDRNPLSPWWYWLLSVPIIRFDATLYLVRRLVELMLALAVTGLLTRLLGPRSRPLALVVGVLVLACGFNHYREQIMWNFQLALALGTLAIAGSCATSITIGRMVLHSALPLCCC